MTKRLALDLGKYLLAVALLAWVVHSNWAPSSDKAVATLAASTVALGASSAPDAPLVAAACAFPGRTEGRGLGFVWQRYVCDKQPLHVGFLAAACVLYVSAILLSLFRWHLLVRALDLELSLRDAMRYGLVGIFFNTFLPGAVGGDIIKATALARTQNRRTAAVATVIMDRAIALWSLFWFVALLGLIFWTTGLLTGPTAAVASTITTLALTVVAVSYSGWVLIGRLSNATSERFARFLERLTLVGTSAAEFWRAMWLYRQRQQVVIQVMLLTWLGHAGLAVAFWCSACTVWGPELGPIPSLLQHFLLVPIGLTMQALVPTPGGAGAGEWGFAALYLLFHAAEANGVLASLAVRVLSWVVGLGGYLVYVFLRPSTTTVSPPLLSSPLALSRSVATE